ncbi:MarR family transcriptional regulator [Fusibacter sp. JL216-2]|uniref:MarR family transcriptional regulator n=1 Tax=Fusibacter sp. JL216-2 TaxID=3071453 RepID=UPI003D32A5CE
MKINELLYLYTTIDLTATQYKVLLLLRSGERTQSEIAKELFSKRQNVNKACKILEGIGLIVRSKTIGRNVYFKVVDNPDVQMKGQTSLI